MTSEYRLPIASFLAAIVLGSVVASAALPSVTTGRTFSVASLSGVPASGTHFHSDHAGALFNPPDKAEVGSLKDQEATMEECRGLSEFDLTGLALAATATLQFSVDHPGGLFTGQNDFGFTGNIGVSAYVGNNADDVPDYSIAPLGLVGTFSTAGLTPGSLLSYNVTSLYNAQLSGGAPALGFRLQITPATVTGGGAFTFDDFTLTVTPTPEPTGLAMIGLAGLTLLRRHRRV